MKTFDKLVALMLKYRHMKLRSTTPVSTKRGLVTKSVLVAAAVLMVIATPLSMTQPTQADQYDDQMNALNRQISEYKAQASALAAKTRTLQAELARLTAEKNEISAQIKLSQTQYNKLKKEIAETEVKIQNNKDALGHTLANMYIADGVSPLEMLMSSNNIGDYVDQQEYRSTIRDNLSATIEEIQALKKQLEEDKAKVESVLKKQKAQRASLAAKEAQRAELVAKTKGQEAAYQSLVAKTQSKLESVAAQQRAYYQSLLNSGNGGSSGVVGAFTYGNWSGNMGCAGGYPYCAPQDTMVDPWALYNRECVSYVAWALVNRFGKYVGSFNGAGNAYQWTWSAPAYSGAWRVSNPQPGDAVILPQSGAFAPIGHAMIVESVSGGSVRVSQYNFYGTGEYSTMTIGTGGVVFLRFPNR